MNTDTTIDTPRPRKRWWPLVLALVLLVTLASQMPALWRYAVATTMSLHAQDLVRQWQSTSRWISPNATQPSLEQWSLAGQSLEEAIELNPTDAQLLESLALLQINHLRWHSPAAEEARAALERANDLLDRANQLRPMSGNSWAAKALALYGLDTDPANIERRRALWYAFDRAMAYGQANSSVQQSLAQIAFARWKELSPERQAAVRQMAAQATPSQRKRIEAVAASHGLKTF